MSQSGNDGEVITGRFAPSPTGRLHTGSLVTAVGSRLLAKSRGGRWLLRLDDLDAPRQIAGVADDIMATLESFSLFWDGEISRQSLNTGEYEKFFEILLNKGALYPCRCSRREITLSASPPHPEDDAVRYPGTCRHGISTNETIRSWRIKVLDEDICFSDLRLGIVCRNLARYGNDFVVRRGDGGFAYQLAVVVDDFITGVNQVARGDDLLHSTARQIHLQRILGIPEPEYCHFPLVTGQDGKKLSKRDNLVSSELGNWRGREPELLMQALAFLGQSPPQFLVGAGCAEIVEWGEANFDPGRMPQTGGELFW